MTFPLRLERNRERSCRSAGMNGCFLNYQYYVHRPGTAECDIQHTIVLLSCAQSIISFVYRSYRMRLLPPICGALLVKHPLFEQSKAALAGFRNKGELAPPRASN